MLFRSTRICELQRENEEMGQLHALPNRTKDGQPFELYDAIELCRTEVLELEQKLKKGEALRDHLQIW